MIARSRLLHRAVLAGIALCVLGGIPLAALGSGVAHGTLPLVHPAAGASRDSPVGATNPCNNSTGPLTVSYSTNPANASGPAPLALSWSFTYCTAANETISISVQLPNGTVFAGNNGSTTLTLPATYQINYTFRDCVTGLGCYDYYSYFWAYAWGSGGIDPAVVNATPSGGAVPLTVTLSATVQGGPVGAVYEWTTSQNSVWTSQPTSNVTFYEPGEYYTSLCIFYPAPDNFSTMPFWCGSSPMINVTGSSSYFLNVTLNTTNGTSPLNVSTQAIVSNGDQLPSGTYLTVQIYATPGAVTWANATYTSNAPTSVQYSPGSGYYVATMSPQNTTFYTTFYALYNVTTYVSIVAYLTDPQGAFLGYGGSLVTLSPAANTPPPPYPEVSIVASPANGSAPLTTTVHLYLQGGVAPYAVTVGAWTNGTMGSLWNFTPLANLTNVSAGGYPLNITLTTPGYWMIEATATDAVGLVSSPAYAYITVGPPLPPPAAPLSVNGGADVGSATVGESVHFHADVVGGVAPYALQWSFGDGTYGSSQLGGSVSHAYASPGSYTPSITVTDGAGHVATYRLAPVVVLPAHLAVNTEAPGQVPIGYLVFSLGSLGAATLIGVNLVIRRRRLRREGETLAGAPSDPEDR